MPNDPAPILDRDRFQRQTMGDSALEIEVLSLFSNEAERLLRQIEAAPNGQVRRERLRAMAGLARTIGALRLVQAVGDAEGQGGEEDAGLATLRGAVAQTLDFIRRDLA